MNILILNQHTSNHGDEAAGKGLIRGLRASGINDKIEILYNSRKVSKDEYFDVDSGVEHFCSGKGSIIDMVLMALTFILPFNIASKFYFLGSFIKKEYELIKLSDKIISGPGGVNIGPYQDWKYIWRLFVSLKMKKRVAIYSISFGPIPKKIFFYRISLFILKNVEFLSLRDSKSQQFADDLGIKYYQSIDTAFLNNQPDVKLPTEINNILHKNNYVVMVPNRLNRWHPNFRLRSDEEFDELYLKIMRNFIEKGLQVILLPQLFGKQNDREYFDVLVKKLNGPKEVVIIDENYSSDIQQKIIKGANFLVGARYHTVIFSVNNKRPFLSLAYEHKMTNTLEIIGLSNHNLILENIFKNNIDVVSLVNKLYSDKSECLGDIEKGSEHANKIAFETIENLVENFIK